MGKYYTSRNGYLMSLGQCVDGQEELQGQPGDQVHLGYPPGYDGSSAPYVGARWQIEQQAWVDTRSPQEKAEADAQAVMESRYEQYMSVTDFMDAFYWLHRGDPSKMEAWLAHTDQVKANNPKTNTP